MIMFVVLNFRHVILKFAPTKISTCAALLLILIYCLLKMYNFKKKNKSILSCKSIL
ncbi:hypothetical protein RhiirA4_79 [Rhizophagus irregularis]|uniref:Uncharacterized protein n=1 Tax=Rhizophagus irregularis TaxID=588596 RepID=A0A2I1FSA2_9GLOM|nr:hypothetical protein RhiirA4_79 [Rhizophagus irregularis]